MFRDGKISVLLLQHWDQLSPNFVELLKNTNSAIVCRGFICVPFFDQFWKHIWIPVYVLLNSLEFQCSNGLVQLYCLCRLYVYI